MGPRNKRLLSLLHSIFRTLHPPPALPLSPSVPRLPPLTCPVTFGQVRGGGATSALGPGGGKGAGKGHQGMAVTAAAVDSEEQKRQRVTGPKWKTGKHMCDSGQQRQRGGARRTDGLELGPRGPSRLPASRLLLFPTSAPRTSLLPYIC